jgi:hypothetical protein
VLRDRGGWGTVWNLIQVFQRDPYSQLARAKSLDMDLAIAQLDLPEGKGNPDPAHFGPLENLLAGIHEQLQKVAHYTAHQPGKPKVQKIPRPRYAASTAKLERSKRNYKELVSSIQFVDPVEFARDHPEAAGITRAL